MLAATLAACGDGAGMDAATSPDAATEADAAVDGGADAGTPPIDGGDPTVPWFDPPADPAPPMIDWLDEGTPPVAALAIPWLDDGRPPVAPPVLGPCPAGWSEVLVDGIAACDPYPADIASCPPGQAHFPGGAGCEEVGDACPTGGALYSPTLPTDGTPIVYVAAGATGGSGTLADPYGSIQTAVDAAAPGTVIAIGLGTFAEQITPRDGLTLHGACASGTIVLPPPPATLLGTLEVIDGRFHVSNLTLAGTRPSLVVSGYTGGTPHVTVHGVYATGAIVAGVVVNAGGRLDGDRLVVRDTVPLPVDVPALMAVRGQAGAGLDVTTGGQVILQRSIFERTWTAGVSVAVAGSSARLEDSVVRDTRPQQSDGVLGAGIALQAGTVELVRAHLSGNGTAGAVLLNAAGRLSLDQVVIEANVPDGSGFGGAGITTLAGTVTGGRVLVRDNSTYGIQPSGGQVDLHDLIIADTATDTDGQWGTGVYADLGANTTLLRARIVGSHTAGVLVDGAIFGGTDVEIRATRSDADGDGGNGLIATDDATLTLERAVLEDSRGIGLAIGGGTSTLTDVAAMATRPRDGLTAAPGFRFGNGAQVTADRLLSHDNVQAGISVSDAGTRLDARDVVARDTQLGDGGTRGIGLFVITEATAAIERGAFTRNGWVSVLANGGTITLSDAIVEDTAPTADGTIGEGVGAAEGGLVQLTRAIVRRNHRSGLYAFGEGSRLELTDVLVADTEAETASGQSGLGAVIQLGADGALTRVLFDHNRHIGLAVGGPDTVVTASDVVVRDTQAVVADGSGGRGINLQQGADLTLERASISGCRDVGLAVFGDETHLDLSDLSVADIASLEATRIGGWGFTMSGLGTATIRRARIERARATGFLLSDGAQATVEDLTVLDTAPVEADESGGRGLNFQNGAQATVTRALVRGSHELAVFADSEGTEATLASIEVRDTESAVGTRAFGGGIWAQLGAHLTVRDALVLGNRYAGISAVGSTESGAPDVTLEDVVVHSTRESECAAGGGCPAVAGGIGIGSYGVGMVRATRFRVIGNDLCGIQVAGMADLDLTDGLVADNPIGACVQREGYDLDRLSAGVTYDNDINIDATTLPVPSAADSLSDLPTADDR